MKKKVLGILLASVMALTPGSAMTVLAADTENAESVIDFGEEPYTISLPLITISEPPMDLGLVQDTLNEYLLEKINAKVQIEAISISNLTNTYTMKAAGGEKMDLISMLPASSMLLPMVSSNMLLDVTDLLDEWGQGIIEDAGQILDVGQINGKQYFIPCFEDAYTAKGSLTFNSELVKKYDLEEQIKAIQSIEDVEPILALIKENEPTVIPFTSELAGNFQSFLFGNDNLGDGLGVIDLTEGDELKVVNWYETETFKNNCKLFHDWFEKGYISRDAATSQDAGVTLLPAGAAFCMISSYAPNQDEGFDLNKSMVEVPLESTDAVMTSNAYLATGFSIAASCKRPDKVMQFLNLLYTDSYVCTLLQRGIEGIHYQKDENGLLANLNMDSGYYIMFGQFGDQKLDGILAEMGVDYEEKRQEFCEQCSYSPAFGFLFDSTDVATQVASCNAVVDEYYIVLSCGSVDPETEIPKFVEKLEAAGLNDVIEAKQAQLDAWAELQK